MSWLVGLALLGALVGWLVRPRKAEPGDPTDAIEPVDQDELDAAEREVRDLGTAQQPDEGFDGDDWGPGASGRGRGKTP